MIERYNSKAGPAASHIDILKKLEETKDSAKTN
jgi:hypothetical protein